MINAICCIRNIRRRKLLILIRLAGFFFYQTSFFMRLTGALQSVHERLHTGCVEASARGSAEQVSRQLWVRVCVHSRRGRVKAGVAPAPPLIRGGLGGGMWACTCLTNSDADLLSAVPHGDILLKSASVSDLFLLEVAIMSVIHHSSHRWECSVLQKFAVRCGMYQNSSVVTALTR